ncbi:phosphoribosyltransferase [Microbispora hainanensis]|uniref:phosphoribosyltransferase n=1 Tax=Microbispora hainanensis TaxID=568844 RepID=UPI0033C27CEA
MVPISYAVKRTQHAYALAAYKGTVPSPEIQTTLLNLLLLFITDHHRCVARAAHVDRWSHVAVVPSTRGRPGEHPLRLLIGNRLRLPRVRLTANSALPPDLRSFHRERFSVSDTPDDFRGARVLLVDDTWTTGARVQSASHALKQAGAERVAAIVLGRHANPEFGPWEPILRKIKDRPYLQEVCAVHAG